VPEQRLPESGTKTSVRDPQEHELSRKPVGTSIAQQVRMQLVNLFRPSSMLVPFALLALGCSSDPTSDVRPATGNGTIKASASTKSQIGVSAWVTREEGATTFIDGVDDKGNVVIWFERRLKRLPSGDVAGEIRTAMGSEATLSFLIHKDGSVTIEKNELPDHLEIVSAASLAVGDFAQSGGGVKPQSLVGGAPELTPGVGADGSIPQAVGGCGGSGCQGALQAASAGWTSSLGW
jgi:hypothetical protein